MIYTASTPRHLLRVGSTFHSSGMKKLDHFLQFRRLASHCPYTPNVLTFSQQSGKYLSMPKLSKQNLDISGTFLAMNF